jgi:hypothetical protein
MGPQQPQPSSVDQLQQKIDQARAERERLAEIATKRRNFKHPTKLDEKPEWLLALDAKKSRAVEERKPYVQDKAWVAKMELELEVAQRRAKQNQPTTTSTTTTAGTDNNSISGSGSGSNETQEGFSSQWLRAMTEELSRGAAD